MSDSRAAATLAVASNVYYLPAVAPAAGPKPAPSRWANASRTWWRLRFALAGVRLALRPSRTPLFVQDDTMALLEGRAEMIERRPRQSKPARVLDFDAARARLRPVAVTS